MPKLSSRIPAVFMTAALALAATVSLSVAAPEVPARESMQKCVAATLSQLARQKAPEDKVGMAVATQCDKQLRATLADAIRNGEAGGCTVDACLDLARARAADQAIQAYRQYVKR